MSKVIPCPNCGQPAIISTELSGGRPFGVCDNPDCGAFGLGLPLATWNHRIYPKEIMDVLKKAEKVRQTPFYKRVALIDAVMELNEAVRNLKEMEAKDETK